MGPVNWLAVGLATVLGVALGLVWNGMPFRDGRSIAPRPAKRVMNLLSVVFACFLAAAMFGHAFARIGAETLAVKPWLYFMQTGGIALAFVMPSLWLTHTRLRTESDRRALDCLFWLVTYLAMGTVFWLLG
ncbi:DUF1761 domain-containing protein [Novosphingobium sp. 1949]|uniref:DUF1761 domain-containing protein n=1 Tax=Novosphingobium organovorum TaxID=2930092 RepID=A0ABT0BEJ6_9SPHN|nr:DUF1761 domain-containing protein [Novosphingobium organovorum]MCJ2183209.1 DUF1761 domain-containing protein [Novosphingobium organovorum]